MTRIEEIIDEFENMEPEFRLELLLDYAEMLPPLPEHLQEEQDRTAHLVPECQTPVFLWVDVQDGKVRLYADVPPESPTVRGFMGILIQAFEGASPPEVLAAPDDLLRRTGLAEAIGMRRLFGLSVIYRRIKAELA